MRNAAIAAPLLLMSLLSWWIFPGHTWLEQDTQIYEPILEHLRDPAILAKDLIVERPHVAFTLYDEFALLLQSITGADFHAVLMTEQIAFRTLGLWGVFLIATSMGLELAPAMLVTLIWSLGATVNGPAVLTVEYEPVPRGFAIPLLMLAIGLASHGRWVWSGVATAVAAVLHPPAVWPVLLVYSGRMFKKESRWALVPFAAAMAVLIVASRFQPGITESQTFFSVVTPQLEMLQRMRASYNWLDIWWREYLLQYMVLAGLCFAASRRLAHRMPRGLQVFALWLPIAGLASVPVTWLLLNVCKWALIPQIQPMRALLFITAMASVLGASAGCAAASRKRFGEALLWFLTPWLIPTQIHLLALPALLQALVWVVCAGLSVLVCTRLSRVWWMSGAYSAMAAVVTLYPNLHTSELKELSSWAKTSTPVNSVFAFADNGKSNYPGVFRAEALRAVYVDWKSGGQVNYLPEFGNEWWKRWQALQQISGSHYRELGINYAVRNAGNGLSGGEKVFANSKYWVYRLP